MEFWAALILAGLTGTVSAAATVAAIKTDIAWIKESFKSLSSRVHKLEEKIL